MPYIKQEERKELDSMINELSKVVAESSENTRAGKLNYIITKLMKQSFGVWNYETYNRIAGIFSCCDKEFYRMFTVAYEEEKRELNGNVEIIQHSTNQPKEWPKDTNLPIAESIYSKPVAKAIRFGISCSCPEHNQTIEQHEYNLSVGFNQTKPFFQTIRFKTNMSCEELQKEMDNKNVNCSVLKKLGNQIYRFQPEEHFEIMFNNEPIILAIQPSGKVCQVCETDKGRWYHFEDKLHREMGPAYEIFQATSEESTKQWSKEEFFRINDDRYQWFNNGKKLF